MATKTTTRTQTTQPTLDLNSITIQPNVTVDNVKEAIDFYTRLGFETQVTMPGPDGNPTFGILSFGNCVIHVVGADGPHPDPRRARQIKKGPRGLGVIFYVLCPNIEAVHKTLQKNKVTVLQGPTDQFWGDRTVVCLDPFGYEWTFGQHMRDVSPEEMARAAAAQFN